MKKYITILAIATLFCFHLAANNSLIPFGFSWNPPIKNTDQGTVWQTYAFQVAGWATGLAHPELLKNTAVQVSLTRGPYLQMGSQSAVTLRWRTNKASDSKVEVGTTYGSYNRKVEDGTATTEHEVRITGLSTDTKYYYRFGSSSQTLQGGSDNYFVTAPSANNSNKVRIAVFGDCGRNEKNVQTKTLNTYRNYVGSKPAELLLLLGDNAYEDGTDAEYQEKFFDVYSPNILRNHVMFPAPGNHDYHTTSLSSRSAPYYKVFTMPTKGESGGVASGTEAYYSFDWGNIHFISLDSHGEESDGTRLSDTQGPQARWVQKDLAANTKPWVIVYWHHPPYSMGSHNSDTESQLAKIRQNFVQILENEGVDLVLTGHSHNYERSYMIHNHYGNESSFKASQHAVSTSSGKYNSSSNSAPYTKPNGKGNYGTVYVVSGSSGALGGTQSKWPHNAMPFSDNKGGMLYLEVEQNRLDAKYLRSDGVVWDQFTIMKGVNKKTNVTLAARGGSTQLTASWLGTYQWSTGETTRTITVDPGNNTSYQVTDDSKSLKDIFQVNRTTTEPTVSGPIPEDRASSAPRIFPTLVSRGTRITVEAPMKEQAAATVMDINGRLVYKTTFNGTTYLETAGLPNGMYLIRLHGKNYVKTQKFIVRN